VFREMGVHSTDFQKTFFAARSQWDIFLLIWAKNFKRSL
jgi:hypothetical protein